MTAKNDAVLIAGLDEGFPRVAAREGLPLPGLPEGITVKSFGSIDGTGPVIFFFATLQGKTVNAKNDGALCAAYADGTVRVLAREGDSVDGKSITVLGSLVGVAGTLADGRWLAGNDLQPALGARLTFSDKSQAIYKIPAAAGAPWIKLAETGTALGLASFGLPGFGPDGAAFRASWKAGEANVTSANDTALFHSQGGMMTMLARESEPAPGADGNPLADLRFKSFSDPVSGAGQTGAFTAVVTGTGVKASNRTGLWSFVAGTKRVRLLARAGDAAPGGGKWAAFPSLAMSDAPGGGALFLATRVVEAGSPLSAKDNLGLWAVGSNGTLQALVQTGQMMQVGNGTKKVASFVALKAAAGSIGAAQGYDNEGRVAVLVTFDDRSEALIISVVP